MLLKATSGETAPKEEPKPAEDKKDKRRKEITPKSKG